MLGQHYAVLDVDMRFLSVAKYDWVLGPFQLFEGRFGSTGVA
jgi:hypothetical protein